MEINEPRRLYQQLAAELKARIEQGVYLVGDKLPAERFIADEKSVSRTVVREAIIMLEVEGYVEVRKGSGIHVISSQAKHSPAPDENLEFANYGPFELLQARQLIESNIAEFAATQVTKQDIMKLMEIQDNARKEKCFRDSEWDLQFHVQVALATQNTALAAIVEKMWTQRVHNPYWKKLHDHIDSRTVDNWCDDHDQILKALIRKDRMRQNWRCGSISRTPNRCCSMKPATTSNSMPTAIFLRRIRWFTSIPPSVTRNKPLFLPTGASLRLSAPVGKQTFRVSAFVKDLASSAWVKPKSILE